jgi:hypothetical protein
VLTPKITVTAANAEALAKGSVLAQEGIRTLLAEPATLCWKEVSRRYRQNANLLRNAQYSRRGASDQSCVAGAATGGLHELVSDHLRIP